MTDDLATRLRTMPSDTLPPATTNGHGPARHDEPEPRTLTDAGNADRLVDEHGDDLRYVPGLGWHAWDGRVWRHDVDGAVLRRARDTIRNLYLEASSAADDDERKRLAKHAARSESNRALRAMVDLAAVDERILLHADELDTDPWTLCVGNGLVDLRSGTIRPHEREACCTRLTPIDYRPDARAPIWDAFLRRITADDAELTCYLQRAFGYTATGHATEQVLFVGHGGGANGKSTTLETIRDVLGEYAAQAPAEMLLADEGRAGPSPELLRLRGARLVTASETGEDRRLDENFVKRITGGDAIAVRALYSNTVIEYRPAFAIWLATNNRPTVRDHSEATWRRLRLVPFAVTIPKAERDPTLVERLRGEAEGILAWCVRGAVAWARDGLGSAPAVEQATEDYRADEDELGAYLEAHCIVEPGASVIARVLYEDYTWWARNQGSPALSQTAFGRRLSSRGIRDHRTKSARFRMGVRLISGDG
jgi:putative DNA primase/helicase